MMFELFCKIIKTFLFLLLFKKIMKKILLVVTSFAHLNKVEIREKESRFMKEKNLDYKVFFFHPKIQGSQVLEDLVDKMIEFPVIYVFFQEEITKMGQDFYKEYLSHKKEIIYLEKI